MEYLLLMPGPAGCARRLNQGVLACGFKAEGARLMRLDVRQLGVGLFDVHAGRQTKG